MCHGIPRSHPCSHSSVTWSYCPASTIDLKTGYETPCSKTSFGRPQATAADCPLRNCAFAELGGSWTCCMCRNGPNHQGWCDFAVSKYVQNENTRCMQVVEATCGHGCCSNCSPSQSRENDMKSAEAEAADGHKSSSKSKSKSKSSSRKSSGRSHTNGYPSPSSSSSPSSSPSSSSSSSSSSSRRRSSHARDLTPESPVEIQAHLYAFRDGYGYCGPLDEIDEEQQQQQQQVWAENSPCSSQSSSPSPSPVKQRKSAAATAGYAKASGKRKDRR